MSIITRGNPIDELFSSRKIIGQRLTLPQSTACHIPEKVDSNLDFEYNPFQSKFSLDKNIWNNRFQQVIPWQ